METTTHHPLPRPQSGIRKGSIVAALAFSLAGCVNYAGIHSDKQIAAPEKYESTQSLPAEGGKWPAMNWAGQFGDPQLPALIDEALRGNPTIDQARARIEKASAYIGTAKSALYPNANGSYTWTRQRYTENGIVPPPYGGSWQSENSLLASVSWDLDLWGKNRERLHQAVSSQKVADAEAEEVRITLAASVASTYNQLALLYALRDIQVHEVSNRETIAHITEGRVNAGLDSNVERQTAYGETATSRSSVSDLDGQIKTVRYQLGALLGAGPDRGLAIANPSLTGGDVVALPDNLPADLLSRRPDIVAAYWKVDAAVHDVKEAKAEFYPDVNLSLAAGLDAFGWGRFLTTGSRQFQAAPAIHLPIFDAGALRSQLKGRYADFDYDVATYNQTLIGALSDVATQVTQIRSTDQQLVDARKALDAQTTAYQLAVARYRSGLSPQLQVLNADDNRLAAETAVVNLEMGRRGQQVALIKALGGGFDASQAGLAATAETPIPAPSRAAATN
ncbi:efflux transporter outer membrane subunit [Burkholderia ubonensis]|uniref:efflux transporter outer membrane subunit n=1 Tax=Burkholderia ubonensis TaxID=101571 RepID=UPI00075DC23A|nr:efflux transporter outer membrane subunit [Burkholderia ubonensis]KVS39918.1 MarR family transcriptional regulator [Burkholderia ubonensis]KVS48013.1 MarR family transcriptional regulator [Burkholderia ubonensis]KVS78747.1 MarR family transcriptional regulator [Burkholderia ubonensis]KVS93452.1 MarR family transcriptional regulator [Burkholderia ubonensis]KVS94197.1 MarR family transcriptional regulator [Burkholderia ubonensis]